MVWVICCRVGFLTHHNGRNDFRQPEIIYSNAYRRCLVGRNAHPITDIKFSGSLKT
ncbi:MAG: hypothetical protein J5680_00690 [Neisseriaceae bacterium]|nr:hypothetical protein [Neisseriaceae bacterium]